MNQKGNGKQDLGLAILAIASEFGAWSAWNSSLFTISTFVDSPEKKKDAKLAMDLGLLTALGLGAGIYLVYGDKGKFAAVASAITGGALYTAYTFKMNQKGENNGLQQTGTW